MMSLWGDSAARSSSFSSRPVYLRSASSPAMAVPIANRPAIPKPPKPLINGPLSPLSTLPVLLDDYQPPLPSAPSLPDTIALNGDEYVPVLWHPPSPPVSEIREPVVDHVVSFVHKNRLHVGHTMREFPDITPSTHQLILHRLECKLFEYPKVRIDYFGDLSRLVITIPGESHEEVAANAQNHLRQSLFDQGFYWPQWGDKINSIRLTGSADRKLTCGAGQNPTIFQPDGSLKIAGLDLPFLIIEVADTESYKHARTKSRRFLMGSKGKTRFVILIDLIRKTAKEMKEPAVNGLQSDELGGLRESLPAQPFPEGNKRAAPENTDSEEINKRPRTASPALPPSPTLPPLLPVTPYSRATVTVLTTRNIDHPEKKGLKLCTVEKLIDEAECWPTMPAEDVCFTFSWEDMNVMNYPTELRGRTFTVRFEWLNELLQDLFGVFPEMPTMQDTGDIVYEDESEQDSEDTAIERERLWALEAKVESGKIESDDSWK